MKLKNMLVSIMTTVLVLAFSTPADDKEKDEDRIRDAGKVLTEVLNVPDDIPQKLL